MVQPTAVQERVEVEIPKFAGAAALKGVGKLMVEKELWRRRSNAWRPVPWPAGR
ncbi:MAG: hypothetical protein ACE5JL_16605 [Dehalococcoidia bacterium]